MTKCERRSRSDAFSVRTPLSSDEPSAVILGGVNDDISSLPLFPLPTADLSPDAMVAQSLRGLPRPRRETDAP